MDSLRRGTPTNDAVLRMHAVTMADSSQNGGGDDIFDDLNTANGIVKKVNGVAKSVVTGKPLDGVKEFFPKYKPYGDENNPSPYYQDQYGEDRNPEDNTSTVKFKTIDSAIGKFVTKGERASAAAQDAVEGKKLSKRLNDAAYEGIKRHIPRDGRLPDKWLQFTEEMNDLNKQVDDSIKGVTNITGNLGKWTARASIAIAVTDGFCSFFGLPDPIDWVRKYFFGDWEKMDKTAKQWAALSKELDKAGETLTEAAKETNGGVWEGEAADAFTSCCGTIAQLFDAGVSPCSETSQVLVKLEDVAQTALNTIIDCVDTLISLAECLAKLAADSAIAWTGVGAIKLLIDGIDLTTTIADGVKCVKKMYDTIQTLMEATHTFEACVSAMTALVNQTAGIKMVATAA